MRKCRVVALMVPLIILGSCLPIAQQSKRYPTENEQQQLMNQQGKEKINEYKSKYRKCVGKGRAGIETIAIIELAIEYLEYLGVPNAARELLEVYETGQYIEYNPQNNTQKIEDNTQNANQSEDDRFQETTSGVEGSYY